MSASPRRGGGAPPCSPRASWSCRPTPRRRPPPRRCCAPRWWTRPDPLAPVPEVEEVLKLAAQVSPGLAALAILSLGLAAAAPVLASGRRRPAAVRLAGWALAALLFFWNVAPALGAFPQPLVG